MAPHPAAGSSNTRRVTVEHNGLNTKAAKGAKELWRERARTGFDPLTAEFTEHAEEERNKRSF